jgi:hypothetical protein
VGCAAPLPVVLPPSFLLISPHTHKPPPPPQINLKSQIVKVTDLLEVTAAKADASELLLCWPRALAERLSRIRVVVGSERHEASRAPAPAGAPTGAACWSAAVPVKKGATASVEVNTAFTGVMRPNPAKISQEEDQNMEFEDTVYLLSPYKIEKQTTSVRAWVRGLARGAERRLVCGLRAAAASAWLDAVSSRLPCTHTHTRRPRSRPPRS